MVINNKWTDDYCGQEITLYLDIYEANLTLDGHFGCVLDPWEPRDQPQDSD